VVLLVLAWGGPAYAGRFPTDPVEDLRQALKQEVVSPKARKDALLKIADRITNLGDLSRAMLLRDWRYKDLDADIATNDLDVWTAVARRFKGEAQKALHSPDPERAAAAATLVGEMAILVQGAGIRTLEVERAVAEFVPDLKDLAESPYPGLRLTALRAMGKLGLQAQGVLPVLKHALETDGVAQRRAAAESLLDLIRLAAEREKEGATSLTGPPPAQEKPSIRPEAIPNPPRPGAVPGAGAGALPGDQKPVLGGTGSFPTHPPQLLDMSARVVPIAALALRDADAEVRRLGTETIHQAAQNLTDSILLPVSSERPPVFDERGGPRSARAEVEEEWRLLTPLMDALKGAGPALAAAARDPDPTVRTSALRALEQIGYAREKLMRRWYTLPPEPKPQPPKGKEGDTSPDREKGKGQVRAGSGTTVLVAMQQPAAPAHTPENLMPADPLRTGLEAALPSMVDGLSSRDVKTRLAAVDALEMLGDLALPAVPALTRALGDPNVFVRWAAARTLGKMVPEGERVVPASLVAAVPVLARLLPDPDLDLRVAVANALGRFGPAGRAAVPGLAWAATNGDAEGRIAAIEALGGIGTDAAPAIPAIVQNLSDPDARVRLAACRLLGRFGPEARPASVALRALLIDPDADVRRAASDAMLSIVR
jgi:HEAT repeat protein